jgi:hypothetical protein
MDSDNVSSRLAVLKELDKTPFYGTLIRCFSSILWHVVPLLGNESTSTFPWQKRTTIGHPLLDNGPVDPPIAREWVLSMCPPRGYISSTGHSGRRGKNPRGGGVEYLHHDPASRRRRRKGKSRIWESKVWPRVLRDSDPKMTALARASSNCKRQTRPLVREGVSNQQTRNYQTIIKIWS